MELELSEILARGIRPSPAEAVAVALAVARRADAMAAPEGREVAILPESIRLTPAGGVVITGGVTPGRRDPTRGLAALVYALLRLDERTPGESRAAVPGGLVVLLARALGGIDLPSPSYPELREGLGRFGGDNPAILAALYARCSSLASVGRPRVPRDAGDARPPLHAEWRRPAARTPVARVAEWRRPPAPPRPPDSAAAHHPDGERRQRGMSAADLRRCLREAEREIFELRARLHYPPRRHSA